jgi:Rod binding domain-containing protein
MDSMNLTLANTVLPQVPPGNTKNIADASQAKKEQFAKDFESVFIEKLLDEMKNTIGDWGFEQDGASQQVQGLFWLNLARDVSKNGGIGMWKEIYQSLENGKDKINTTEVIDNKL